MDCIATAKRPRHNRKAEELIPGQCGMHTGNTCGLVVHASLHRFPSGWQCFSKLDAGHHKELQFTPSTPKIKVCGGSVSIYPREMSAIPV
jgi:hypothetical protein